MTLKKSRGMMRPVVMQFRVQAFKACSLKQQPKGCWFPFIYFNHAVHESDGSPSGARLIEILSRVTHEPSAHVNIVAQPYIKDVNNFMSEKQERWEGKTESVLRWRD